MKKRAIALVVAIFMMATLLVGCTPTTETVRSVKEEVYIEEETKVIYGNYFLFKTRNAQEYLNFLETFDDTKYEIVDISTSLNASGYGSDEFYIVTYKVREFESE